MLSDHLYARCEQIAPLNSRSLQEGHPHSVDKDDAVEDIEFYVHYAGKRSRVVVHDQNHDLEFLNKTRVMCYSSDFIADFFGQCSCKSSSATAVL